MANRRFDSLAESLASGTDRRSIPKGIPGIGGEASIGGVLPDPAAEAARRPTALVAALGCRA